MRIYPSDPDFEALAREFGINVASGGSEQDIFYEAAFLVTLGDELFVDILKNKDWYASSVWVEVPEGD